MGFGFSLFFVFVLVPITVILLLVWIITRRRIWGKALVSIWAFIILFVFIIYNIHFLTSKKELSHDDVYGEYVIDRDKFAGVQADWQYNHFRFEITKNNEFLFHVTDGARIIKTYKGQVELLDAYAQPRIILHFAQPIHHIIEEKPTLYRQIWSFYYVFNSPYYGNVFFIKGKWKPID